MSDGDEESLRAAYKGANGEAPLGFLVCKRSARRGYIRKHSHIICDNVWMPTNDKYFCFKACLLVWNSTAMDKMEAAFPVRRRPDADLDEQPPARAPAPTLAQARTRRQPEAAGK